MIKREARFECFATGRFEVVAMADQINSKLTYCAAMLMRPTAAILALLTGCGGSQYRPQNNNTASSVSTNISTIQATVHVRWTETATTPNCFFFSGPHVVGRDDHLGDTAMLVVGASGQATLTFPGASTIRFEGQLSPGGLRLEREAGQEGGWRSSETLVLTGGYGNWSGRYVYLETAPGSPTVGDCRIDSRVAISEGR